MKQYISTGIVEATPMTRLVYNGLRGWSLPADENPEDEGYLVHDTQSGEYSHVEGYDGYVRWAPKKAFESLFRPLVGLTYGLAVEALKQGMQVARAGWDGKGMYVQYVPTTAFLNQHFELRNVAGTFDTWVASVSDTLAEDWYIVE